MLAQVMPRVFVYGTLKRGEVAHAEYMAEATFLGVAQTPPRYRLVSCGWYPGLVAGGHRAIHGEVYSVDAAQLARLDEFEEVPEWYQRILVELESFGEVWIYLLHSEHAEGCPEVPGASWTGEGQGA